MDIGQNCYLSNKNVNISKNLSILYILWFIFDPTFYCRLPPSWWIMEPLCHWYLSAKYGIMKVAKCWLRRMPQLMLKKRTEWLLFMLLFMYVQRMSTHRHQMFWTQWISIVFYANMYSVSEKWKHNLYPIVAMIVLYYE